MKYLILALLIALPANAATFKSVKEVKPINGSDFVVGWDYEFYFSSPAGANPTVVFVEKESCTRPRTPDGRLLFPQHEFCYDTETLARPAAQKTADAYEKKERQLHVSSAKIADMNKKK